MLTQKFGVSWSDGSNDSIAVRPEITGDTSIKSDFTLAAGTVTDQQQQFGFDVADVEGILITVSGNPETTVTLETNATDHTGGQQFVFPAGGSEMFWSSRSPLACPITTDVTTTYWTKTGADTPAVSVRILLNA